MKKIKRQQTTVEQFDVMRSFLLSHPCAAKGGNVFGINKLKMEKEWSELADTLNSMGPPQRTILEWKKVWCDARMRMRKRLEDFQPNSDSEDEALKNSIAKSKKKEQNHNEISQLTTYKVRLSKERQNTTEEQLQALIKFMRQHPESANGYIPGSSDLKVKLQISEEWKELKETLNTLGPPHRSITDWKKIWSDTRRRLKLRYGDNYFNTENTIECLNLEESTDNMVIEDFISCSPMQDDGGNKVKNDDYIDDNCHDNNAKSNEYFKTEIVTIPNAALSFQCDDDDDVIHIDDNDDVIHIDDEGDVIPIENHNEDYTEDNVSYNNYSTNEDDEVEVEVNLSSKQSNSKSTKSQQQILDETNNDDISRPSVVKTLKVLEKQIEQQAKLIKHIENISGNITKIMERNVVAMDVKNQLMERQLHDNEVHTFLMRREETRKRNRFKFSFGIDF